MASQKLTDYERKRLENIRRNEEMMASLKLQSIAAQVSASTKRPRAEAKVVPKKQPKTQTQRRSLRTRGLPPAAKGLVDKAAIKSMARRTPKSPNSLKAMLRKLGPLSMREAYGGGMSHRSLFQTLLGIADKPQLLLGDYSVESGLKLEPLTEEIGGITSGLGKKEDGEVKKTGLKLETLTLNPENIAQVVTGRIMNLKFVPCTSSRMVVVGNKFGNVGFWHIDSSEEKGGGVSLYRPHTRGISGISIQQHCMSKIYTSCFDGFIRLMDAEKEVFDLVYSSEETIYTLSQQSKDPKCLYFAEGEGVVSSWDERAGKSSARWCLHENIVNSISFDSENSNLMATSSTDGTACIWDLRSLNAGKRKRKPIRTIGHKKPVYSAYFSPSGRSLATTSTDDTVGISSGVNFKETSMISHNNRTGTQISSFRAIWGWDDAYVFIGSMTRGVDVISAVERRTVFTLRSPHMSAIPCKFDVHPYNVGMLAGATSGGQVYVWTLG